MCCAGAWMRSSLPRWGARSSPCFGARLGLGGNLGEEREREMESLFLLVGSGLFEVNVCRNGIYFTLIFPLFRFQILVQGGVLMFAGAGWAARG